MYARESVTDRETERQTERQTERAMKTASLGLLEVMVVRVNAGGMPPDTIIKLKCFI